MGNLTHGSLGYCIEHGQVIGSHMAFNVQYEINKGRPYVMCEVT